MQRERVTESIYVFTSDLYAQVTAGVVLTHEGAVLIDTLAYPKETMWIKRFVEERLRSHIRYVVNTHYHADHTTGTYLFDVPVIAHSRCRDLLDTRGRNSLESAKQSSVDPELDVAELRLPDVTFSESYRLHLGDKSLRFWSSPGHSDDSIMCLVEDDQVLFAADTLMPIPYFVDGDYDHLVASLQSLDGEAYENIVQGHGEIILRGEITEKIQSDIDYLVELRSQVDAALNSKHAEHALNAIDIESCGKSRILLNGTVEQLHRQNVIRLAKQLQEG